MAARSPMRDALLEYVELERAEALVAFRHQQSLYAAGALKDAPAVPPILKTPE